MSNNQHRQTTKSTKSTESHEGMKDVVTTADLPNLREWMVNHGAMTHYSDEFRAACCAAIKAIDIAATVDNDDDGQLSRALHNWVETGRLEIYLHYYAWSESIN